MTAASKRLRLVLTAPRAVSEPVRVTIGECLDIRARLLAENVSECEAKLIFDDALFDNVSGEDNPRRLGSGNIAGEVSWRIRAKRETAPICLEIEGRADQLFQKIAFFVEVLQ